MFKYKVVPFSTSYNFAVGKFSIRRLDRKLGGLEDGESMLEDFHHLEIFRVSLISCKVLASRMLSIMFQPSI